MEDGSAVDVRSELVDLWEASNDTPIQTIENADQDDSIIEAGMPCRLCRGTGYNASTVVLYDGFHGATGWCHDLIQDEVNALAASGRLWEFTHKHVPESPERWEWKEPRVYPEAVLVNEWSFVGFGHDCVNQRICVEVRAMREGFYGLCPRCGGEGEVFH